MKSSCRGSSTTPVANIKMFPTPLSSFNSPKASWAWGTGVPLKLNAPWSQILQGMWFSSATTLLRRLKWKFYPEMRFYEFWEFRGLNGTIPSCASATHPVNLAYPTQQSHTSTWISEKRTPKAKKVGITMTTSPQEVGSRCGSVTVLSKLGALGDSIRAVTLMGSWFPSVWNMLGASLHQALTVSHQSHLTWHRIKSTKNIQKPQDGVGEWYWQLTILLWTQNSVTHWPGMLHPIGLTIGSQFIRGNPGWDWFVDANGSSNNQRSQACHDCTKHNQWERWDATNMLTMILCSTTWQ